MKGLCLSGGGIKAAAHIGALKAIEENNIKFDCVAGTSSGSIIATLYALGFSSDEMWDIFKANCAKIKYIEFNRIIRIIFGLIFHRKIVVDGLNSGKVIEKLVNKICIKKGIINISQIKMPLLIPSVDLQTGTVFVASSKKIRRISSDNTVFITDFPIGKAVRASCSYPAIISPCIYDDKQLVDGGIRENLPWKELKQIGADEVLGINFESILSKETKYENIIEISIRSIDLICRELSIYEKSGIDNLITIPFPKISLLDTKKIDDLYQVGYLTAKNKLKYLSKN